MSDPVIENCTKYAFCDTSKISDKVLPYIEAIMKEKQSSGIMKEKIIAHYLNLAHNPHKHGVDASGFIHGQYRLVEAKSETIQGTDKTTNTKLLGRTTWGVCTAENLVKIWNNDELVVVSGWTEDGQIVYIVTFNFCESKLYDEIHSKLNTTTQPKGSWKHFPDSCNVMYLNAQFKHLLSTPFKKAIDAWKLSH